MAGFFIFLPFRMVAPDKVNEVLFGFDMRDSHKIINLPVAELTLIFHFRQSLLQQQVIWLQESLAVPKQSKLPSERWMFLIRSFLENLQVSLIPAFLAFFSISESRIFTPPFYTL